MRCIIAGNSVKVFAKAIHCLAKIGEEIYLEPLTKGLSLRTVNSSRSAYACFLFLANFFQSYHDGFHEVSSTSKDTLAEDILKCKLSVKSCLSVFKSLTTVEKIVDRCSIKMNLEEATLTFLLYCHHGITKTYNLTYQDCESLQAVFTKDLCPNVITAQPRIFTEVVMNFQNTQEEITLTVCPQDVKVTNYVDDEPDPEKVIRTEMVLVPEEFDNYQIGVDTEVTFCLKELKAILTFAESSGQPMDIHFEFGGKLIILQENLENPRVLSRFITADFARLSVRPVTPIVFSLTREPTFEANFVLATLIDTPSSSQHSQQRNSKTENARKTPKAKETESTSHAPQNGEAVDEFGLGHDDPEDWEEGALAAAVDQQIAQESLKERKKIEILDEEDFFGDSFEYQDLFGKKSKRLPTCSRARSGQGDAKEKHHESVIQTPPSVVSGDLSLRLTEMPSLGGTISADSENSPGIAVRSAKNNDGRRFLQKQPTREDFADEKQPDETVPGTPPSKKFKSMFFSMMADSDEAMHETMNNPDTSIVLAADTDEESD